MYSLETDCLKDNLTSTSIIVPIVGLHRRGKSSVKGFDFRYFLSFFWLSADAALETIGAI